MKQINLSNWLVAKEYCWEIIKAIRLYGPIATSLNHMWFRNTRINEKFF
ncbi:MAG: hypothetical protein WBP64_11510 [Nitrososphaeraceae archaeon]